MGGYNNIEYKNVRSNEKFRNPLSPVMQQECREKMQLSILCSNTEI